ncbi:hypothetical protein HOO68_04320 [Candidatus Gracilibacteria bacterium]|nr:hypothetical protein [Candidatus Gracilibacteria bacterium]
MLLHRHFHHAHHHTKKHLHAFHIKHGVSVFTIGLLVVLAVQINIFYFLGMMPIQTLSPDVSLSFAGSLLPITEFIKEMFVSIF